MMSHASRVSTGCRGGGKNRGVEEERREGGGEKRGERGEERRGRTEERGGKNRGVEEERREGEGGGQMEVALYTYQQQDTRVM